MKNSAEHGGCYPQRPKAEVQWIIPSEICRNLHILRKPNSITALLFIPNIFPFFKKEFRHFALCFFSLTKNYIISSPGFLGQRFNNLKRAALLTSLIQYGEDSFQNW